MLGRRKQKTVAERTADAMDVFTSTATKLRQINSEAIAIQAYNDEKIDDLVAENLDLNNIQAQNDTVIENIDKLTGK